MSERRACRVIDADRKSVRYRSTRDDDADLREKLRELANQRRRFGYRRLHILLRREGIMINRKKTQRLYKEEGLALRFNDILSDYVSTSTDSAGNKGALLELAGIDNDGSNTDNSLTNQISDYEERIEKEEDRLDTLRELWESKFSAMESAFP